MVYLLKMDGFSMGFNGVDISLLFWLVVTGTMEFYDFPF